MNRLMSSAPTMHYPSLVSDAYAQPAELFPSTDAGMKLFVADFTESFSPSEETSQLPAPLARAREVNMGTFRNCLIGALATLSFGPAVAQTPGHEQAIKVAQSVSDLYVSTFNKHDAPGISMLFVPDGVFLPPDGGPVVQGREALERHWAELFKSVGGHETVTVKDAIPVGNDGVVSINEYKIVGDNNKIINGRALLVLAKTSDGWRYVTITAQPPPPAAK
jgi:uncharacterized protein (TIGR02246 family)